MTSERHDPTSHRVQHFLGTAGLMLGAVVVCLGLMAEVDGQVPFFMPRSWYATRSLWYFFAIMCFVGGGFLLKSRSIASLDWTPTRPGVRFRHLVLYTRESCELCETAKDVLSRYGDYLPGIEEVDIETDPQLIENFGTCVPVVELDGKVRFRGRLDETLLRRLIEGTAPLPLN